MNENIKKRIIGVIILVILSVILAPVLFKGSGQSELKFNDIDEQDNIKFKYIDEVKKINKKKKLQENKQNLIVEKKIIKEIKNIDNGSKSKKTWVIRVGSFIKKNNAQMQLEKLKRDNYQSYIVKLNSNNKIVYAVNIGPYFSAANSKKNFLKLIKNNEYKNSYIIESKFDR
ncbi:MAG: hypothetical protein CMD72_02005 [Gammaproteobacteria bacterium]|nr:hypothetical protein [Gammaproteobacteria bacterium]